MKNGRILQTLLLAVLFALAAGGPVLGGARGSTPAAPVNEEVLYKFCSQGQPDSCTDGGVPIGGLIMDGAGNLYGTNSHGGSYGYGTVFQLTPTGTGWSETVLYNFCSQPNCIDGASPAVKLIMDGAGNLYSTTREGGSYGRGYGTVYRLAPTDAGWVHTVLYSFCAQSNCADGMNPFAGLTIDGAGNLYGTTPGGSLYIGNNQYLTVQGNVFKLSPTGTGWSETVLYRFCSLTKCADGQGPEEDGLVMDEAGNLYGTTLQGGSHDRGAVFKLAPTSSGWAETVLYSFCSQNTQQQDCTDGAAPNGLLMDSSGNLYGTTRGGGPGPPVCNNVGCGTVFKLSPTGPGWTETVLYSFCQESGCADGANPGPFDLIMDPVGNLYGLTGFGGGSGGGVCFDGCGTAFMLTPSGTGWSKTPVYSFCSQTNCADGAIPNGLLMDPSGNLYGTTYFGGIGKCDDNPYHPLPGCGVVFRLNTGTGYTLSVAKSGNGSGTVTSSPPGIDCGSTCGAGFPPGTQVTLTAVPASGSAFAGWGGACSGTGACMVTINGNVSVAAGFASSFALSVSAIASPGGTVTSSPAGVDCGSTCGASFAPGTQVVLTASPAPGWGLAGWGGACSGIGGCTVTMNASTSVSARFTPLFTAVTAPPVGLPTDVPALPAPIIGPIPQ
jgi:uncharacterized repeat protein (TIGR03803 family)